MTRVEYLFQIAKLDLESVRHTAGSVRAIVLEAKPGPGGQWYEPWWTFEIARPPMAFLDLWALDKNKNRMEFKLLSKDGSKVIDSTETKYPTNNFFGLQVEVSPEQFKKLKTMEPGDIYNIAKEK